MDHALAMGVLEGVAQGQRDADDVAVGQLPVIEKGVERFAERRAAARASRSKRPGGLVRSRGRILTATSRSRRSSRAIQTVPKAPAPSRRCRR
jgi:hypothetical protein